MAQPHRENPFLILLIFLILTAGLVYFLILVWEIPSPAQTQVRCPISSDPANLSNASDASAPSAPKNIFLGDDAPDTALCAPDGW